MSEIGFLDGSMRTMVFMGLFLVAGFLLERRCVAMKWAPYFRFGMPLWGNVDPLAWPSSTHGATDTLNWLRLESGEVVFWADAKCRRTPTGLHGTLFPGPDGGAAGAKARWAPPWTPVMAALWLMGLGMARGEVAMTFTIALGLLGTIGVVYGHMARRAIEAWDETNP